MLTQKLLDTIRKHGMFSRGDTVVAAVSGGPDSVALLHALWTLADDLGISIHVAHLNHGIRGKQADRDAAFAARLADNLGLPRTVEKADARAVKELLGLTMEEAARKVRYEFLDQVADSIGAARVATAHTSDDQAETVLMNLIRGAGPDGLSGIPPVRGRYVRPLLAVSRREVLDYCATQRLDYRIDPSNSQVHYRRNRVRLELIPLLESGYNTAIKASLTTTAEIMRAETEYLSERSQEAFRAEAVYVEPSEIGFDVTHLLGLAPALQRRVLRRAIECVKGDLKDVEFRQAERVLKGLETGRDFAFTLPSGTVYARRRGTTFSVSRAESAVESPTVEVGLTVPGRAVSADLGVAVTAEVLPAPVDYRRPRGSLEVLVDRDRVVGKLTLRNWRAGDRIVPLGMTQSKKLQDIFTDAKVPRRRRGLAPVVADDEKIVWVVGLALSEQVRITGSTTQALRMKCERIPD